MTDSKKNKAKTNGEVKDTPDLQQLWNEDELLKGLMETLAWSGDFDMGNSLLAAALGKETKELKASLKKSRDAGAVEKAKVGLRYQLPEQVREQVRELSPIAEKEEWVKEVGLRMADWFEERRKESSNSDEFAVEVRHLEQWGKLVATSSPLLAARFAWFRAYPPFHKGEHDTARQWVLDALALLEKEKDADYKLKVEMISDLGTIAADKKELDEALKYRQQALETVVAATGENHVETTEILNDIGSTYDAMGDEEKALTYFQKALTIRKEALGEEHEDTASAYNNVGTSHYESGHYQEAIEYLEHAFQMRRRLLGDQNSDTADSLHNLAVCMIHLKRFKEAYNLVNAYLKKITSDLPQYRELTGLLPYIDRESLKWGFRPPSAVGAGKGNKKKKKKKKK